MRPTLVMLLAACSAGLEPGGQPAARAGGKAVATVNGRVLTEDDVAAQPPLKGHDATPQTRSAIIEALVDQELAAQRATEQGLAPDAPAQRELQRLEAALAAGRRRALANAWFAQQAKEAASVSEADARAYFDAHARELEREVHVAFSLRRDPAELSPDTLSDAGWLSYALLPPQWRPVLAALRPGETSAVIKGDGERYWRVRLLEVRDGPVRDFEAARPVVQQLLAAERVQAGKQSAERRLRGGARVTILEPSSPEP